MESWGGPGCACWDGESECAFALRAWIGAGWMMNRNGWECGPGEDIGTSISGSTNEGEVDFTRGRLGGRVIKCGEHGMNV